MILIDRITEITEGVSLTAIKNVTINEPYFAGHFPNQPVMPAVLILEIDKSSQRTIYFKFIFLRNS